MSAALLAASSSGGVISILVGIALVLLLVAAYWKIFTKAGRPGWAAIIPFYNAYTYCKVAKRPGWWFILVLIPIVGFVIHLIVSIDMARAFKKGTGFGIGLWILPFIFGIILGFGSASYDEAPVAA